MNQLKQIHAYTLRNGIDHNRFLIIELLRIPNIPYAHNLFSQISRPNVFLYNKLIQAYSSQNQPHQCLSLYAQMCIKNCSPNQHSFTFLFTVCASLNSLPHAQTLHSHFLKSGFQSDVFALTALVDMYAKLRRLELGRKMFDEMPVKEVPTWNSIIAGYAKCGHMEAALELFRLMPARNVVSWTAIISGFAQNGEYPKSLSMFLKMEAEKDVRPNEVTIASVIPACANLGALEIGQRIEKYARENGFFKNIYVCNAVLELYAKCGKIDVAKKLFNEIGKRRNLCSWNSMIMGLAVHGKCNDALELYEQMLREGPGPDDVTFVGLFLACTHGGMVKKGRELFESMEKRFDIPPKLEHFGCMVDLLGRAGQLQEAYDLIQTMPMKPDSVVWGALLGACSFHVNVELGEIAAESLFKLEPWNPGNFVILSNIYASAGKWDGVARLRKAMKGCQILKGAGYSLIEEGGDIHKFIVEDKRHARCDEIYALLDEVSAKMKLPRYVTYFTTELEELCLLE
ncbi:pentatricopeptide repeat-containing protein At5g08510 [Mangifera indica]|uniref:pentatricopeptide repeat-containing protein At5g08510 n=1 Tax=Mangifera indica TaxID=29780 RepID=UPI001CF9CAC2|nr:pentatricopeptide repeat-containing protein At5g08510 [Mangifera indica]